MSSRYPEIEPYERGMLDVGDGHQVYWETCGNPAGKPVLVLHGGPGSGCTTGMRRYFDPARYRIVLFDQRNCGRSTPHASRPVIDLSANTTGHLVADMELLREKLGIQRWQLFGGSWGSALALVYATRSPERVTELVLMGVATGRRRETDLLTRGLGGVFPRPWADFRIGVPEGDRDGDLADAYYKLLTDPDPAVHVAAARRWCDWEIAIIPTEPPKDRFTDAGYRLAFARIVTHYWRTGSWLAEGEVLAALDRLAGIPGVVVQGVLDTGNFLGTAWELTHGWPDSELVLIDDAGHNTTDDLASALVTATDRFADRN
ncbi:MAG TPA: prolyl aminopeptidase [Pseudonocardiaceae bacterium]|jgi:proline iminopeptidase|nr:prolyl aminopeptidase [Pseudonocardiaceae bacterium]